MLRSSVVVTFAAASQSLARPIRASTSAARPGAP
jgi:hypothetical protein